MRLKGKVAIITGGGGGIARSLAAGFGKEGARLALADINPAAADATLDALKREGIEAISIKTDVSSPSSTQEMAKKTFDHFGRIDILVNTAALFARHSVTRSVPFYEIDPETWDRVISVNLKGTWLCSKAVFPFMKAQGGGKVINLTSGTFFLGVANLAHYVASKGGIIGLTRAMAININCIAPGSTFSEDETDQEAYKFRQLAIPVRSIKRVETPEDLVGTAMYLASSDSDFVTGQTIVVDGGHIMH
jgi:NAD(P)-dependent dehydrogenase (short-subunit alcohol dehydrogenase family)